MRISKSIPRFEWEAVILFILVCICRGDRVQMEMGRREKAQIQLAGNKAVLASIAVDLHEEL